MTRHVDGDTLHLVAPSLSGGADTTVRLLEVDTPESVDPNSPDQCHAAQGSRALAHLLPVGSRVWFTRDKDLIEPYGRTLLYL